MSIQGLCKEKTGQVNKITAKSDDGLLTLPACHLIIRLSPGPRESDGEQSLGQVAKGCERFPFPLLPLRTTSLPLPVGEKLSVIIIHVFGLFLCYHSVSKIYHEYYKRQNLMGSWKLYAKWESDTKAICYIIPFIWNVQNRPIYKDSMWLNGHQRQG